MKYKLIQPLTPSLSITEQILVNRGINLNHIPHFLNTTVSDILDPSTIKNIQEGARMLAYHIQHFSPTLIQVDPDADGYTSAAILINYLYKLFPTYATNCIKYRLHDEKQHGIITKTIPEDIKLVIAPDSSSNNYEEHKELSKRGVDILVIDHHEAKEYSPNACVINNQLCDYPTKSLSGAGMVYKFCNYLDRLMDTVGTAEEFLDLAALGIISDMMVLQDFETREIVREGLLNIKNPFFSQMIEDQSYSLKGEVTPIGVAFYITPYINATIRCGTAEEKLVLFEAFLEHLCYEQLPSTKRGERGQLEFRLIQACRNCKNIKNRQTKVRDQNIKTIENLIREQNLLDNKILIVRLDEKHALDKNLTGLLANQLMSKYKRPVLLLKKVKTVVEQEDGTEKEVISWEGSARGYDKSDLKNFKDFIENTKLVLYGEGHQNAFGCGIAEDNYMNFVETSNAQLKDITFGSATYEVDFIFTASALASNDILEIASLKPYYGQGVEEPYVAIENIVITPDNIQLMSKERNPTLKIVLPNGTSIIKFHSSIAEYEALRPAVGCTVINAVGRCAENTWNGRTSAQFLIEDYEISQQIKYYF